MSTMPTWPRPVRTGFCPDSVQQSVSVTFYRLAVLGDPVEHSRSPSLHEAMLSIAGLEGTYEGIRADRDVLSRTVAGLREGHWQGLNVTMPLKEAAAELCDDLGRAAERSRSVNTLLAEEGRIVGHSTDSTAFRHLLADDRFVGVGSILLIGAGGSAAAAMVAIDGATPVYVAARRRERAEELTNMFGGEVIAWGAAVAGALVINTTPLGMKGETLPDGVLSASGGLIDLPYAEVSTPAIRSVEKMGLPRADGHEFLILQAMESFRIWTGARIAYQELLNILRNV